MYTNYSIEITNVNLTPIFVIRKHYKIYNSEYLLQLFNNFGIQFICISYSKLYI